MGALIFKTVFVLGQNSCVRQPLFGLYWNSEVFDKGFAERGYGEK